LVFSLLVFSFDVGDWIQGCMHAKPGYLLLSYHLCHAALIPKKRYSPQKADRWPACSFQLWFCFSELSSEFPQLVLYVAFICIHSWSLWSKAWIHYYLSLPWRKDL
jgi:hypothetical protein